MKAFWEFYMKPKDKMEWVFMFLVSIGITGVIVFVVVSCIKSA